MAKLMTSRSSFSALADKPARLLALTTRLIERPWAVTRGLSCIPWQRTIRIVQPHRYVVSQLPLQCQGRPRQSLDLLCCHDCTLHIDSARPAGFTSLYFGMFLAPVYLSQLKQGSGSMQAQSNMLSLIQRFADFYPCPACAQHLRQDLKKQPPAVSSREDLSQWFCRLHNRVNQRLGKPQFDCSQVLARWRASVSKQSVGHDLTTSAHE